MVTIDESIQRQLNEMTANKASQSGIDTIISKLKPASLDLMRQFTDYTQYEFDEGYLSSDTRRTDVNAAFLNEFLAPGMSEVEDPKMDTYLDLLQRFLGCVRRKSGHELEGYLFMDTAILLPSNLGYETSLLLKDLAKPETSNAIIKTWGVLSDNSTFGSDYAKLIGTRKESGPLLQTATKRAREIYEGTI